MGRARGMIGAAVRLLAAWAVLAGCAVARDLAPGAGAFTLRFGGDATSTRVVLDLEAAAPGRIVVREDGRRLTIDFSAIETPLADQGQGRGLVGQWALAAQGTGARVSLDLAAAASVRRRFLIPPSMEVAHWRYVLDLRADDPLASLADAVAASQPTARPEPHNQPIMLTAAASPASSPAPPPRLVPRPGSSLRPTLLDTFRAPKIIVIDPGHGGRDTGAQSPEHNEKDITLAAGLALKARLERLGGYRVVLTRADDTFIPLPERVRMARAAHADLFISLHADSAGQDPTPHGASVYTVNDHGVTRVNEVVGPHDLFMRVGDRRADPAVGQILMDLSQRSTRNRSSEFAGLLIDHIGQCIDVLPHGRRDASYFVLLAPDVPAVLMEMGFITNPGDETRLTDPEQRRRLMDRVGDAIDDYFAPRREIAQR